MEFKSLSNSSTLTWCDFLQRFKGMHESQGAQSIDQQKKKKQACEEKQLAKFAQL